MKPASEGVAPNLQAPLADKLPVKNQRLMLR